MARDLTKIKMLQKVAYLPTLLKAIEQDGADAHDKEIVRMLGLNPFDVEYIGESGWLEIIRDKGIELELRINSPMTNGTEFRVTHRTGRVSETMITRTISFGDGFALSYIKLCIKLGRLL